jgi:hypothetical protein
VIDIADVHELPDLFQDSELGRLYRLPEVVKKMEERGFSMDNARAELLLKAPELAPAMLLAPTLHGPLALAVSGLNAETLGASPTDLPWVVTAVYDAGEQADRLAAVLAPLCASLAQRAQWNLVEKPEPAWGCEAGNERLLLDLDRRGDVFLLRFGGRAAVVRELALARKRSQSNSFASTRVASGAASVESLGAEPAWKCTCSSRPSGTPCARAAIAPTSACCSAPGCPRSWAAPWPWGVPPAGSPRP